MGKVIDNSEMRDYSILFIDASEGILSEPQKFYGSEQGLKDHCPSAIVLEVKKLRGWSNGKK